MKKIFEELSQEKETGHKAVLQAKFNFFFLNTISSLSLIFAAFKKYASFC